MDAINTTSENRVENATVVAETPSKVAKGAKMTQSKSQLRRQPIGDSESAKRSFTHVAKGQLDATFSFRLSEKDKERYQVTSRFDFSQCTTEEILELAASSVRITVQGKLRDLGQGALDPTAYAVVNVKSDIIDAQKAPADDTIRGIRALARAARITEEQARAIVEAELAKKVAKK